MVMFRQGQMVKILCHDRIEKDSRGNTIQIEGEKGLVILVNDRGTGRVRMQKSNVVIDGVIPEECEPV